MLAGSQTVLPQRGEGLSGHGLCHLFQLSLTIPCWLPSPTPQAQGCVQAGDPHLLSKPGQTCGQGCFCLQTFGTVPCARVHVAARGIAVLPDMQLLEAWTVLGVFSNLLLLHSVFPLLHNESHHSTAACKKSHPKPNQNHQTQTTNPKTIIF